MALIRRLLAGKDPALPRLGLPFVDVRNVAAMHLAALDRPASVGRRYLAAAGSMWLSDVAHVLGAAWPDRRIVTRTAPGLLVRLLALLDADLRESASMLGEFRRLDSTPARRDLEIDFVPVQTAVRDCAAALVALGA